jgi:outer membrane protein assembly factor BamB
VFAVYGTRRTFVDCRYYGGADWDYLVGDGLGVTSLDMSSGQELWTRPFADGVVAMCAASAGCVFVVSGEGLHVLDPASGAPRLIVPTRSSQACLVQLPHAPWHVLFANEQGLWRADARSAEAVWYSPAPYGQRLDIGLAGVVVGRRTAAVMTRGGVLRAVDLSSGATVWEHPPALVSALHGTRDVLLVDSRDLSRVDAYSGASGEPMWHLAADSIGRDGVRTCAVAKGSALVFSSETKRRRVACVRLADGAVLARRPASDGWNPSCATTENSFWYRQDGSTAVGLSKTTGREVGRICLTARGRTDASAPCIGQVIGLGDLVVAEVKEGLVVVGETE